MTALMMILPLIFSAVPPEDILNISATIDADRLEVGKEYSIHLKVKVKDGWTASDSGIPHPLLQIKVPKSVKLSGKVLSDYRELSRNEFLQEPFERLIKDESTLIKFKLLHRPSRKDRFRLNVLSYVSQKGGDDAWFIRRRFKLRIKAGADASIVSAKHSNWGQGHELQIGDQAVPFDLPRADGSTFSLKKYLGRKNILVTTYRAFW